MPRPKKCRRICKMPENLGLYPANKRQSNSAIIMTVDEYECIRLIDKEGFSQEDCGNQMKIARTTVQQIYTSARKKMANCLVDGHPLKIIGGDVQFCDGLEKSCRCNGCSKYTLKHTTKGNTMKIVIPLDENKQDVCPTFGRSPFFYIEENGKTEIIANPAAEEQDGAGPKAAQFLIDIETDVLLTVRCGQNAADVLKLADIKIFKTQAKTAEINVSDFHQNKLEELTHFHAGFQGIK